MSDETVVETDGITVNKSFNAADFPVPAVAFEVSSSLDQAVDVRIVDEIPDEFGIDQIGFHPEYESEHWTASGDGVVRFEREVDAGESFTTVYGVRMEEGQDEAPFLSAPTVEVEAEGIEDVVPPESTSVVRELAGGERDTVPGLEDDDEAIEAEVHSGGGIESSIEALEEEDAEILGDSEEFDETPGGEPGVSGDAEPESAEEPTPEPDVETEPPAEPGLSEETEAVPTDEPADDPEGTATDVGAVDVDESEPATPAFDADEVAGALAEAIREDRVSDDDLETLQEAFGGVPRSTRVEIEHVQSRVSELEAYTDALEEFIDEEGTAEELLDDVEDEVEDLEDDVADLEADLAAAGEERETLRTRLQELEGDLGAVDDLREDVDRLAGDLDALDERVADVEDVALDLEDVEDDLEDVREDVDEIEQWRSQLSDVFGT